MINIISFRKIHKNASWQIIQDWEDEFSESGNIPIKEVIFVKRRLPQKFFFHRNIFPFIPKFQSKNFKLFFSMVAPYEFTFSSFPDYVPIIIDAWKPDLWRIEKFCKFNKFIFLASLEAVYDLNRKGVENVYYSPVSISKKYQCNAYPEKDIDLLVYGRNHVIMWDWINKVSTSNIHVVTCYPNKEKEFIATSNKKGIIGKVNKREDLMTLLKKSKYSTVSSTGNDKRSVENYIYTGGFSPVTPRFLECTVNYCQGVGIWLPNVDFNYFEIDKVAVKTETFEKFQEAVNIVPNKWKIMNDFDAFLDLHWSYKRIEQILAKISEK